MKETIEPIATLRAVFNADLHAHGDVHTSLTQRFRQEALETNRRFAKLARERQDDRAQQANQADDPLAMAAVALATSEQIEEFREELSRMDHAAIEALYEIDEELAEAESHLARLRENAHTIHGPDGAPMRVYRDGEIVRDESGTEIGAERIDPREISADRISWQDFWQADENLERLRTERKQILEYRERIQDADAEAERGGMTEHDLQQHRQELRDTMPERVLRHYERAYGNDLHTDAQADILPDDAFDTVEPDAVSAGQRPDGPEDKIMNEEAARPLPVSTPGPM